MKPEPIIRGVAPNGTPFSLYPPSHGCTYWQLRFTDPRSRKQVRVSSRGVQQVRLALMAWATRQVNDYAPGNGAALVTVADLVEAVLQHKRNHQPRDYREKSRNWELRLKDKFGSWRAKDLTASAIEDYKTWCAGTKLDSSASRLLRSWPPIANQVQPGTVNLDLALLSKAYNDGIKKQVISTKPHIAKYTERQLKKYVRQGFLDQAEYDRIQALPHVPLWLKAMLSVAFACGNRAGELKSLEVRHLNFLARTIRLDVGSTKNGEGRLLGMTEEMYQLLQACCWSKQPGDYVFTRDGKQVGDFRKLWANVLHQAGIGRRVTLHDFRRSAARNALNRGLTEQEVMQMGGWRTRSMLDRYNVRREDELVAAMKKIEAGAKAERELIRQTGDLPVGLIPEKEPVQ